MSTGATGAGGGAIGSAAGGSDGSSQLMQATQGMKEKQMGFNLQDLGKPVPPPPRRKP